MIQRDSHPVVYDPREKRVLKEITLANNSGNPALGLCPRRREVCADDYDTLLKLDLDSLEVKASRRIQSAPDGTAQFIGRWSFNEDESLCLVPRPFSGDVLAISAETMKTQSVAKLGGQPLEAAFLDNGRLIARDWKTVRLLKASLQRA